jgi:hypothetical protein
MQSLKATLILLSAAFLFTSCDDSENLNPGPNQASDYIVHLRVGIANGTADYILNSPDIMSGSISAAGTGIEQTGWRYSTSTQRTLLSVGYYDDNNAIGYGMRENGEIYEKGRFTFETTLDVFSNEDDGNLIAMEVPRSGFADRVFYYIDGDQVRVRSKVPTRIYENRTDSLVAWPTAMVIRDNQVFVPFYTLHSRGDFTTPSTDTAYVAVYSYPEFEFQEYLKDTRMGPMGIYGNKNGLVLTENGDMYGYSSASLACGFTTQQKSSGILRIRNGETEFDDSYFYDIEAAAGGDKLVYFEYVGNGLAIGRLITDDSGLWSYYGSADVCKLVVIDLINRSMQDIANVPLHKGQYAPMLVENGKVYVNVSTGDAAHIYEIDPQAATAVQGAQIQGREIHSLTRLIL